MGIYMFYSGFLDFRTDHKQHLHWLRNMSKDQCSFSHGHALYKKVRDKEVLNVKMGTKKGRQSD